MSCQISYCDFENNNLTYSNFEGTEFKNTFFKNSDLSFASFKNATNYNINPNINIIKKAKFSLPEALSLLDVYDVELV